MNGQEILDRLRENERALRERGVTHAALFGSRERGELGRSMTIVVRAAA
jgi:predicted nucleotidyltransferase